MNELNFIKLVINRFTLWPLIYLWIVRFNFWKWYQKKSFKIVLKYYYVLCYHFLLVVNNEAAVDLWRKREGVGEGEGEEDLISSRQAGEAGRRCDKAGELIAWENNQLLWGKELGEEWKDKRFAGILKTSSLSKFDCFYLFSFPDGTKRRRRSLSGLLNFNKLEINKSLSNLFV